MSQITIAKNAGFCFGVKRAVDEVNKLLDSTKTLYCIGELIHNKYQNDKLSNKGLIILEDRNDILNIKNEHVVIRSHGIEKDVLSTLIKNNNTITDLTCPYVKKIHDIVASSSKNGDTIIVVGDKDHPEVKGIVSYAINDIYVIKSEDDINALNIDKNKAISVVSQTTQNKGVYQNIVDNLSKIYYNIKVYDTICLSTENRQNEAISLAKNSDFVFVIGGKNSSNTLKLYDICQKFTKTFFIENISDLNGLNINHNSKIGVVAGASTPLELIEEIVNHARF